MTTDPNPTPKSSRLWVRILLVVSLALNLLVIGAVAGFAIKGGPLKHGGPPHVAVGGVGPLTQALTREDRRAIGREMRRKAQESGWDRRAHRQALERMVVLLEATPFDAEAFDADLNTIMDGMRGRISDARGALVNRLSDMSDEDRAAYAERIRDKMDR